jgi:hypothetical protein
MQSSKKGFVNFILVLGTSLLLLLFLELDDDHHKNVPFSILGCIPLIYAWTMLYLGFIYPIFNRRKDDDNGIEILGFLFTYASVFVGWAMIYMIFWNWNEYSFANIDTSRPYHVFVYMLTTSIYTGCGTAAAHVLPEFAFVGFATSIQLFMGWITMGIIVASVLEFFKQSREVETKSNHHHQHNSNPKIKISY